MDYTKLMDDDVTLTAGAADHTSTVWELVKPRDCVVSDYRSFWKIICIKITNGGTGPTVAAQAQIQVSTDGTNYYNFGSALTGNTDANGVESVVSRVEGCFKYVKVISGSNTDENVTIRVEGIVDDG